MLVKPDGEEIKVGKLQKRPEKLSLNEQQFREFKIDLEHESIFGSSSITKNVENKYVSLALLRNDTAKYVETIEECKKNADCSSIMISDSEIFNFYSKLYACNESET